jgi:urease beta subunit
MVDQRFISRLISDRVFNYVIDVTNYDGKEVANRVIDIPHSILTTFEQRRISFTVVAGDATFTFNPGFSRTPAVNSLVDIGQGTSIRFTMTSGENIGSVPALTGRESYLTRPQKLELLYKTQRNEVNITTTANQMNISLRAQNRLAVHDSNIAAYIAGPRAWERQNTSYDAANGRLNLSTVRVGTYSAIAVSAPQAAVDDWESQISAIRVQSMINITDMNTYQPNAVITASQLNKLIAAVALESGSVQVNGPLTASERTSLQRAGMLLTDPSGVRRESGIDALVKLYELKTGRRITGFGDVSTSFLNDISDVSPQYRTSILKADRVGFFGSQINARPDAGLTISDALRMLDIIITDAGL